MNLSSLGRCIDQPLILTELQKKMPQFLIGTAGAYGIYDTYSSTKGQSVSVKKKKALKNFIIISTTVAASLIGAKGLKLFKKQIVPPLLQAFDKKEILLNNEIAVKNYIKAENPSEKIKEILHKTKSGPLSYKDTNTILNDLPDTKERRKLLSVLLPEPEKLDAKGIFSEIGRLSLLGAIPVIGGVLGGITADKVTDTSSKKSIANKIKEGFYQYFANIFLCNVGACAALFTAEKLQKTGLIKTLSPIKKMLVILTGITATGIVGGSYIANKMSQKLIDPLFETNKKKKLLNKGRDKKNLYYERKPEAADIALHIDDIATAGVLSGFKWIEPALPMMYFVSGYRAGIGYRN